MIDENDKVTVSEYLSICQRLEYLERDWWGSRHVAFSAIIG